MNFVGLDIETAPMGDHPQEYALQPWRVLEGSAEITAIGMSNDRTTVINDPRRPSFSDNLTWVFEDCYAVTWNGVFDVAWLIAAGYDIRNVKWVDAMLLWKWASNSQHMERLPRWSLAAGAERWLPNWPHVEKFLKLKANAPAAGEDDAYWQLRCKMDALATRLITLQIWEQLTKQQRRSALIEAACIWPTANSWVQGIKIDLDLIKTLHPVVTKEMRELEIELEVDNAKLDKKKPIYTVAGVDWQPASILRSPKRKAELLYDTWGLPCTMFTDKGARSTAKSALTYLVDVDERALDILRWSELNTQLTKFLNSPSEAAEYLGSNVLHPEPKIFSTYTGRFTYKSKIKEKFKTGLAQHQTPRNKQLRKMVIV